MQFFYLHGFASSPRSSKARFLRDRFAALGLSLHTPDLNQGDFANLTLTRQLQQIKALLSDSSVTLIGSSLGGLTAAWLGEQCLQIDRLILLAPAFGYLNHWLPTIEQSRLENWRTGIPLQVYHYGEQQFLPLSYGILSDFERYDEAQLQKPVPTLILHGIHDLVIPIAESRAYAATRSWVQLIELDSDHALLDQEVAIWQAVCEFCAPALTMQPSIERLSQIAHSKK